jgi:subtilase family serine protease
MTMPLKFKFAVALLFVAACLSFLPAGASAQTSNVQSRITEQVNDSELTVLRGNVHPLARSAFDRGPAPASLAMDRMLLVLKRSPAQEAALEKLMAEQQDRTSPNFHKWLTPAEFGREFGPSDQDIQTVTSWLTSHGFQINNVGTGRTIIQFSGTAGQVEEALHAPIHKFVVNGEEHWANANDPEIPTALTPVIAGIRSLHNFYPKPMSRVRAPAGKSSVAANARQLKPNYTFPANCTAATCLFGLGPADFATIYNVLPLWNAGIDGTGEMIAIVSDSNINTADVTDFRSIFGLPVKAPTVTIPTIANCSAPNINGDEVEAILDVEWSGAVAKNANINLVTCASTLTTFGGDLAAQYIIDFPNSTHTNSSTGLAPILSESFGACELSLGGGVNQNPFYNTEWQQAAAEGITVIVSSGDNGSAGCDISQINGNPVGPAQFGLQVNGLASTPFNIAVGGTDFNDLASPLAFWNTNNAPGTQASAKSYIPESTWNDTCTNSVVYLSPRFGDTSAEEACNDPNVQNATDNNGNNLGLVTPVGASGGLSNCTSSNGINPSTCTGGYAKPSWQVALTPNDNARDLPDVSLFAADGLISGSFYIVCERDQNGNNSNTACDLSSNAFLEVGGTSVSTQVFAGIMALVDQKNQSAQGNANMVLYPLAGTAGKTCSSLPNPASTCVFYDIADGSTIAMPCSINTPNCPIVTPGDTVGVLTGYTALAGYDRATGLGSVNVANLANASGVWTNTTGGNDFTISAGSPTPVPSPGGKGEVTVTVTGDGTFNGMVTFACSALPSETTCSGQSVNGSGQSVITFQTTAASTLTPAKPPAHIGLPAAGAMLALVCVLSICLVCIGFSNGNRRWTAVLALAVFAILFVSVGCGGGSGGGGGGGGGGNPGTPLGTTNVVITATSGSIQRSVSVALTVN